MFKNQLQELAQRSCFNLPSYTCIREGPDHAPRFKATVNFNGEMFESPSYCFTLRQAEHSAAEMALNELASRGPTNSLAAKILDETGVYKNLLQEVSQRVGASLPVYTTFRSGLGHLPVFTGTVELAGVIFTGDPAKTKKQAEKNVAMSAWFSLKSLLQQFDVSPQKPYRDELEHVTVARALQKYLIKARLTKVSFPIKFPTTSPKPLGRQPSPPTTSKILPLICPETAEHNRLASNSPALKKYVRISPSPPVTAPKESHSSVVNIISKLRSQNFPAAEAAPYIPVQHCNSHARIAPPVTIRDAIPVFSAPPIPAPRPSLSTRPPIMSHAPPVCVRQAAPAYGAHIKFDELPGLVHPALMLEGPRLSRPATAKVELPVGRAVPVRLEESSLSKFPVEERLGCKLFPMSVAKPSSEIPKVQPIPAPVEVPRVPVEPPFSIISSSLANSKASIEEARNVVLEKLKESTEIEELKNLKI